MSAELEERNGKVSMAYAGDVPWHRTGTSVGATDIGATDITRAACLDWNVGLEALQTINGVDVPGQFALVRDVDGKPFGKVVGRNYTPIQNAELASVLEEVAGEEGRLKFNTAGALEDGSLVWYLASLKGVTGIKRRDGTTDGMADYLLATNRHGTGSAILAHVRERVVCKNTWRAALGGAHATFRIIHTQSYREKIDVARDALGFALSNVAEQNAMAQRLEDVDFTEDQLRDLMNEILDVVESRVAREVEPEGASTLDAILSAKEDDGAAVLDHVLRRRESRVDRVVELYRDGIGNTGTTMWDALNGVTQWVDHEGAGRNYRGESDETKSANHLKDAWYGRSDKIKTMAVERLLEEASA